MFLTRKGHRNSPRMIYYKTAETLRKVYFAQPLAKECVTLLQISTPDEETRPGRTRSDLSYIVKDLAIHLFFHSAAADIQASQEGHRIEAKDQNACPSLRTICNACQAQQQARHGSFHEYKASCLPWIRFLDQYSGHWLCLGSRTLLPSQTEGRDGVLFHSKINKKGRNSKISGGENAAKYL